MDYKAIIQEITAEYSAEELLQICKVLNKMYNIFDTEDSRWKTISYALFRTPQETIDNLRKYQLSNTVISDLVFKYYHCERVIKYYFIRDLMKRTDHIVAFEMTVGDSRVDICRINGESYAYEIKTEYDSFDRLETQMKDYLLTFEKVYIIVPSVNVNEASKHIPANCGIISYRVNHDGELVFSYRRKATKNACDIKACINSLSSNDMERLLKTIGVNCKSDKESRKTALLQISTNKSIWNEYRNLLKSKYDEKWNFLCNHFSEITPIDIQSFFSTEIDPKLLYK